MEKKIKATPLFQELRELKLQWINEFDIFWLSTYLHHSLSGKQIIYSKQNIGTFGKIHTMSWHFSVSCQEGVTLDWEAARQSFRVKGKHILFFPLEPLPRAFLEKLSFNKDRAVSRGNTVVFSVAQSCWTLWPDKTVADQAPLSFTISQNLFKFMFIESMMPSNLFILCNPLLFLLSIFLSIRVFF